MNRTDYRFEMLPRPALTMRYANHYGKPYTGPWVWVATRRVKGRTTGYDTCKMATGVVHRKESGTNPLTATFDEIDRICRFVGIQSQWDASKYYGLRIHGHERCCGGKNGGYVMLDTPGVESLVCNWCKKPLLQ